MTTLNDNLFSQTYDQILKSQLGSGVPYFQMLGDPIDFVFGTAPVGQTNAQAYQIVSGMPNWSPIGSYASQDGTFYSAYGQVFQRITWKVSPGQEQAQAALKSKVNACSRALSEAETSTAGAYNVAKQNGGAVFQARYPTIQAWLAGPGKSYIKAETVAEEALAAASAQLRSLQKAAQPTTLQEAMAKMEAPAGEPANEPAPDGWTKVQDMGGVVRWRPEFVIGTTGEQWRAQLTSGSQGAFTVGLDASDEQSDLNKSWAGGSASYDAFFWGVDAGGGWEKLDITTNDKSVKAVISVKSSTLVPVSPGPWYDGGFMSNLAKSQAGSGYVLDSPWIASGGPNSMFGASGLLSTRVGQLVVVYQPSFEITMSQATFEEHHEKYEASLGLRIGPFQFGGSGGHESTFTHDTEGKTTFKGGSTSTDPLIIGVAVAFPGVNKP
jgi:hypothetical protein